MTLNRYFQSELSALRQLGRRFSERNPALAPFLGEAGQDPDVERLLEGFAFLTGRLRQKLDDELPELTHSLMHLLWPHYMRPIPAFSILQFDPLKRAGPSVRVARDTAVQSAPIHGERCQFRTCYPTDVMPLQLTDLEYKCQGEGAWLDLRLCMSVDGSFSELEFDSLRLHLAGDHYISQGLYLGLLRHLAGISLQLVDHDGLPISAGDDQPLTLRLNANQVRPVGFSQEQALIPYPQNTLEGYRHLQEYFAFPEKYLFVDVEGLEVLHTLSHELLRQAHGLVMRFELRSQGREPLRPTLDNVKLYCTPSSTCLLRMQFPFAWTVNRTSTFWYLGNTRRAMPACIQWTGSPAGAPVAWAIKPTCGSSRLNMTATASLWRHRPATAFANVRRFNMVDSTPGWGSAIAANRARKPCRSN